MEDEQSTYTVTVKGKRRKRTRFKTRFKLTLKDRGLVEQAVQEFMKGTRKSAYNSHMVGFTLLRESLLREPETLAHEIGRINRMAGLLLPDLSRMRDMQFSVVAYARLLAEEGHRDETLAILDSIRLPALQIGSSADTLISLLVARAILAGSLEESAHIYESLGLENAAAQARVEAQDERQRVEDLRAGGPETLGGEELKEHGGVFLSLLTPTHTLRNPEMLRSWRHLERVLFQRAVLTIVFLFAMLILLVLLLRTLGMLTAFRQADESPKLFFVGWKRLACVVGVSVMLPLALYYAYTRWTPFGGLRYGINFRPERLFLELLIVGVAMTLLSVVTTYRAIRLRCKDAGMAVPPKGRLRPGWFWKAAAGLCLIGIAAYAVKWKAWRVVGMLMSVVLVGLTVAWLLTAGWRLFRTCSGKLVHFRRTFVRSTVPLLAVVLLCLGAIAHTYFHLAERHYVHLTQRPGQRHFTDELEMTTFKAYRDHLAKRYQAITEER